MKLLYIVSLCVGGWLVVNGILHDIFILTSEHGKKYDRTLLRLLMDGHILITCGIMQLIAAKGLQTNESWGFYVAGTAAISILIYCALIFPFLKSMVTIVLNLSFLVMLVWNYIKL